MKSALAVLTSLSISYAFAADDLRPLYDAHRFLDLRDAIQKLDASPFYRGIVGLAFNDPLTAGRELRKAADSAATPERVADTSQALAFLYWRMGRYKYALASVEMLLEAHPEQPDARNMRPLLEALSRYPDQSVESRRPSRVSYQLKAGNLVIPASINGKPVRYILDSGYNNCSLSQSEAKRVGLTAVDVFVKGGGNMLVPIRPNPGSYSRTSRDWRFPMEECCVHRTTR